MPTALIRQAAWPGVAAVAALEGTVSHGISPGLFTLTTYPQTAMPAEYGNLLIGDGIRAVLLRDCKVIELTGQSSPEGQEWVLTIADRRWRWAGLGRVGGQYNVLDSRGKLVPWKIRSPEELCKLCLQALGESKYTLVVPPGLPRAVGGTRRTTSSWRRTTRRHSPTPGPIGTRRRRPRRSPNSPTSGAAGLSTSRSRTGYWSPRWVWAAPCRRAAWRRRRRRSRPHGGRTRSGARGRRSASSGGFCWSRWARSGTAGSSRSTS